MRDKEIFARWLSQLDLSDGKVFDSEDEQKEIEKKMKYNFHEHFFAQSQSCPPAESFYKRYNLAFRMVAAACLIVTLTYVIFISPRSFTEPKTVAKLEKISAPGELTKIDLPDGSRIWLNAGSSISYPEQFSSEKREVKLEGEAYFDVKHDPEKPFLIHTETMVTQVLGTSFNVSSYPQDQQIKVTVLSGKVAVYERGTVSKTAVGKVHFLESNQELVYQKALHQFMKVQNKTRPADAAAWKDGNLIFKSVELSEVVRRLGRHYGITIRTDAELDCPVTANFNKEPLERVMRVLAQLVNGQLSYKNGQYHLTGVLCQ